MKSNTPINDQWRIILQQWFPVTVTASHLQQALYLCLRWNVFCPNLVLFYFTSTNLNLSWYSLHARIFEALEFWLLLLVKCNDSKATTQQQRFYTKPPAMASSEPTKAWGSKTSGWYFTMRRCETGNDQSLQSGKEHST